MIRGHSTVNRINGHHDRLGPGLIPGTKTEVISVRLALYPGIDRGQEPVVPPEGSRHLLAREAP